MDLRPRLNLAGRALLAMLDPAHDLMPTGGYEVAHDLGRWWDAVLRLEAATGFAIPAELEAASLLNLQRLTGAGDGLLMNRADIPVLRDRTRINPHNIRESLLAFGDLVRHRQSAWARDMAMTLVRWLSRALRENGTLDFTTLACWGNVPFTTDFSHTEAIIDGWFDGTATSGRCIEALVWLFEATGEPAVLEVASRLAAHHLTHSAQPDGGAHPRIVDPANEGHNHSYHGTLRGLLLFGLLTGERAFIDTVEATYRRTIRCGIVKESGWTPHDLGKTRFPNNFGDPVSDPASTGDAAQIALWLALHAGCHDLFDDVERYVRARLMPAQLTADDVQRHPNHRFQARDVGAWSIHGPTHGGKGCTPDVLAAVTHGLCDIQRSIVTHTAAVVRVNLHFDHDDEQLSVVSTRDDRATTSVPVKRRLNLLIRVPRWAPATSLEVEVDGRAVPIRRMGDCVWIGRDALTDSSVIRMSFALPSRTTEEIMPSGRRYTLHWRGDQITGIAPQEAVLPFYPEVPQSTA